MAEPLFAGIDLGTARVKVGIFDRFGSLVALRITPHAGQADDPATRIGDPGCRRLVARRVRGAPIGQRRRGFVAHCLGGGMRARPYPWWLLMLAFIHAAPPSPGWISGLRKRRIS